METGPSQAPASKKMIWGGRLMSALPVPLLLFSAYMKISQAELAVKGFSDFGFPPGLLVPIGITELACTILYVIPQTAVLGAVLLTGYLGGAVVVHLRGAESIHMPIIVGVLVWGGIFLRDARVRDLFPFRKL
jgi:hypothetical protein